MSDDSRFNTLIIYTSFALTVLVIFVHAFNMEYAGNLLTGISFFTGSGSALYQDTDGSAMALMLLFARIENLFSETLGQAAVPGFFMISAYLFYRNIGKRLTFDMLGKKWKSRIRSLLVPYLLWNLFYLFVNIAVDRGAVELSPESVFFAVVNYSCNPVFWYMKQLILLTVFAPFIHAALKNRSVGAAFLFGAFLLSVFWAEIPYHIINEDALFYYMSGAYISLHLKDRVEKRKNVGAPLIAGIMLFVLAFFLQGVNYFIQAPQNAVVVTSVVPSEHIAEAVTALTVLCRALMPVGIFFITEAILGYYEEKSGKEPKAPGFMKINFFIYATHYLIIKALNKTAELLAPEFSRYYILFALYFVMPFICVFTAYGISRFLKKYLPRFWNVISGGR